MDFLSIGWPSLKEEDNNTYPIRRECKPVPSGLLWYTPTSGDSNDLFCSIGRGRGTTLSEGFANNGKEVCFCEKDDLVKFLEKCQLYSDYTIMTKYYLCEVPHLNLKEVRFVVLRSFTR